MLFVSCFLMNNHWLCEENQRKPSYVLRSEITNNHVLNTLNYDRYCFSNIRRIIVCNLEISNLYFFHRDRSRNKIYTNKRYINSCMLKSALSKCKVILSFHFPHMAVGKDTLLSQVISSLCHLRRGQENLPQNRRNCVF